MARTETYAGPNGNAAVTWRWGIVLDRITLHVDNTLVDECTWARSGRPHGRTFRLGGSGYRATIALAFKDYVVSYVDFCHIAEPGHPDDPTHLRGPTLRESDRAASDIEAALSTLDLDAGSLTRERLDEAFQRLARRYDPSQYASLPPELTEAAAEKHREIQNAYHVLESVA